MSPFSAPSSPYFPWGHLNCEFRFGRACLSITTESTHNFSSVSAIYWQGGGGGPFKGQCQWYSEKPREGLAEGQTLEQAVGSGVPELVCAGSPELTFYFQGFCELVVNTDINKIK